MAANTGTRLRSGSSVPKGTTWPLGKLKEAALLQQRQRPNAIHRTPHLPNVMESYDNFESPFQQLERTGILEPDIFSAAGPQTFSSQPLATHGPPPGFNAPEFSSQTQGYGLRSYRYLPNTEPFKGFPRSFPQQAHEARRPVNIVLPNGGTEAQLYAPLVLQCL